MAQTVRDLMTPDPIILANTRTVTEAARRMRDEDVGDVLVHEDGRLCGILTDRDIVVRLIAEELDTTGMTLGQICSGELHIVAPDDELDAAVAMMRSHAIRRAPVVEDDVAVGILSIGDLAIRQDPDSALADISQAPPTD